MASQDELLSGVDAIEYAKEAARQIAARLMADAKVADVIDDPQRFADMVLADMMDELDPVVSQMVDDARAYADNLGFSAQDGIDFDAVAQNAKDGFIVDIRPALVAALVPIGATLTAHMAQGVTSETLAVALSRGDLSSVLLRDFTATLRGEAADFLNRLHLGVIEALATQAAADDPELVLTWITMVVNVCDDETIEGSCAPRHGLQHTFSKWEPLGHPWVPNRLCRERCRCVYVTEGGDTITSPVDVKDAIKGARARAVADFGQTGA